jgi:hypothetical protein
MAVSAVELKIVDIIMHFNIRISASKLSTKSGRECQRDIAHEHQPQKIEFGLVGEATRLVLAGICTLVINNPAPHLQRLVKF